MIQAKGRDFAIQLDLAEDILQFSDNWVLSFCKCNAFRAFRIHGESGTANIQSSEVQSMLTAIAFELKQYALNDIFNMDETALFYNMSPITTIAREKIEDGKKDKTRITITFTCNATGTERFEPFFIGHAHKPRCFNKKTGQELGFFYAHNKRAWMTGKLFQEYLLRFDRWVGRPIILLIDNAPSHIHDDLKLINIKIRTLPPNTTSKALIT